MFKLKTQRHLLSAVLPVVGAMYNTPPAGGGDGGGAGGGAGGSGSGAGGAGGGNNPPAPKKIELTEDELTARVTAATSAALEAERTRLANEQAEKDRKAAEDKAKADGDLQKQIDLAEEKRSTEETKRKDAERRAKVAEVSVSLRDHLAADDERKPYLTNAPDIMLHVEKKLTVEMTDAQVEQLIADETTAFIARTAPKKAPGGGVPPGPSRNKLPSNAFPQRRTPAPAGGDGGSGDAGPPAPRRFGSLTWNG